MSSFWQYLFVLVIGVFIGSIVVMENLDTVDCIEMGR